MVAAGEAVTVLARLAICVYALLQAFLAPSWLIIPSMIPVRLSLPLSSSLPFLLSPCLCPSLFVARTAARTRIAHSRYLYVHRFLSLCLCVLLALALCVCIVDVYPCLTLYQYPSLTHYLSCGTLNEHPSLTHYRSCYLSFLRVHLLSRSLARARAFSLTLACVCTLALALSLLAAVHGLSCLYHAITRVLASLSS